MRVILPPFIRRLMYLFAPDHISQERKPAPSVILSPFMRRLIDLFEHNDIGVYKPASTLDMLLLDSSELGPRILGGDSFGPYGLPVWFYEDRVVARFEDPIGVSIFTPHPDERKRTARFTLALEQRGYVGKEAEEENEANPPRDGRHLVVIDVAGYIPLQFTKPIHSPEEALAEAQWLLTHARKFWPDAGWRG